MKHLLDSSFVFSTKQDPDYKIKGARDPLGFQMVWSQVGKGLVKHLSTVSNSLCDFQTLLYFHHFLNKYGGNGDVDVLHFFYKFEQASAFARKLHIKNDVSFNGANYVNNTLSEKPETLTFSTKQEHTLLSNQKTYGIWGKYSRPYNDMRLNELDDTNSVMEGLENKTNLVDELAELIKKLIHEPVVTVHTDELKGLAELYETITPPDEKRFFRENLLRTPNGKHLQNEFYELLLKNKDLAKGTNFNTKLFCQTLLEKDTTEAFKEVVREIYNSEEVLFSLSSIFRYIQTKAVWTFEELCEDPFFKKFNNRVDYSFKDQELNELNGFFSSGDILKTIENLIERNNAVCARRSKSEWIRIEMDKKIRVYYRDGARENKPGSYDNSYFISAYLNLFSQIEGVS